MGKRAPAPKRGRPSLSGKGPAEQLAIRISPALHDQVRAAAERAELSIGEYVREALELAIARGSTR